MRVRVALPVSQRKGTTHLLGGANRTNAHPNAQRVDSGGDEIGRLPSRHHVAAHDVDVGVLGLDVLDHLVLVHRVALRGVDHDYVGARLNKEKKLYQVFRIANEYEDNNTNCLDIVQLLFN